MTQPRRSNSPSTRYYQVAIAVDGQELTAAAANRAHLRAPNPISDEYGKRLCARGHIIEREIWSTAGYELTIGLSARDGCAALSAADKLHEVARSLADRFTP